MPIEEIQNNFFIYYNYFKTETYVVQQKTHDLLIFCNKITISFNNIVFFNFLKRIWCLNHDFEHILHGHVQRLLPRKRDH